VLGLFTLPKLYEMRKDEIDSAVGSGREAVEQHLGTAKAKARVCACVCARARARVCVCVCVCVWV
jgi:hypothetical protein